MVKPKVGFVDFEENVTILLLWIFLWNRIRLQMKIVVEDSTTKKDIEKRGIVVVVFGKVEYSQNYYFSIPFSKFHWDFA